MQRPPPHAEHEHPLRRRPGEHQEGCRDVAVDWQRENVRLSHHRAASEALGLSIER